MLRPERPAIGQFHLVLQMQALALQERREGEGERGREGGKKENKDVRWT